MTFYTGKNQKRGAVQIGSPPHGSPENITLADDVAEAVRFWLREAESSTSVCYFAIYWQKRWVGEILLHDIDFAEGSSLIAYHLFDPHWRGKGIGTAALRLLLDYVRSETALTQLFIITSRDNPASQRIAVKNGFRFTGPSRENPENELVFVKHIERNKD